MSKPKFKSRHTTRFEIPLDNTGNPVVPTFVTREPLKSGSGQMLASKLRPNRNPFGEVHRLIDAAPLLAIALGQAERDAGVVLADLQEMVLYGHVRRYGWSDRTQSWELDVMRIKGEYRKDHDGVQRLFTVAGDRIQTGGALTVMPEHIHPTDMGLKLRDVLNVWAERGVKGVDEAFDFLGFDQPAATGMPAGVERMTTATLKDHLKLYIEQEQLESMFHNKARHPKLAQAYSKAERTWDVHAVIAWAKESGRWREPTRKEQRSPFDF